jgi:hypothetical protein
LGSPEHGAIEAVKKLDRDVPALRLLVEQCLNGLQYGLLRFLSSPG